MRSRRIENKMENGIEKGVENRMENVMENIMENSVKNRIKYGMENMIEWDGGGERSIRWRIVVWDGKWDVE